MRAYSHQGHGPRADQTGRIHISDFRYPRTSIAKRSRSIHKCHKRKSFDSFNHLRDAVAGALLICPNDVGTGSNRDVPSQFTVEALGDFGET